MSQREKFIRDFIAGKKPLNHLCEEYEISEKIGHKWKERFIRYGLAGLEDQSRAPKSSPNRLDEEVVIKLIRLKQAHETWGAKKIQALYERSYGNAPSLSSVKRVLERAGLVQKQRKRVVAIQERTRPLILPEACNDVWAIDFKGWWYSEGELCEPLTIRDLHSRYILEIRLMQSKDSASVRKVMSEVFRKYGLPKVIRTDNGTPFASPNGVLALTNLSAWWITLGIIPDRIDKGKPGQNGSLERMHADIAREIERKVSGGRRANQIALDLWREEYNSVRPNEAIAMQTPADLYHPSEQKYFGDFDVLEYPPGFSPRKVYNNGEVSINGIRLSLSFALRGLTIGLKPISHSIYHVYLADYFLGSLDTDLHFFSPHNLLL